MKELIYVMRAHCRQRLTSERKHPLDALDHSLSLAVPYSLPCSLERKTLTLEFKTGSAGELKCETVASDRRTHGKRKTKNGKRKTEISFSFPVFPFRIPGVPGRARLAGLAHPSSVTFPVTFLCVHRHFSVRPVVTDRQTHEPNPVFRIRLSGPVPPTN